MSALERLLGHQRLVFGLELLESPAVLDQPADLRDERGGNVAELLPAPAAPALELELRPGLVTLPVLGRVVAGA